MTALEDCGDYLCSAIAHGWAHGADVGPYFAALAGDERAAVVEVRPVIKGNQFDQARAVAEATSIGPSLAADGVALVTGGFEVDLDVPAEDPRRVKHRVVVELLYRAGALTGRVRSWDPETGLSPPMVLEAIDYGSPPVVSLIMAGSGMRADPTIGASALAASWRLHSLGHKVAVTRAARHRLGHLS